NRFDQPEQGLRRRGMPKSGAKARPHRSGRNGSWPVTYRWIAMGTLVVYTAVGTKTISRAWAQNVATNTAGQGTATAATLPVKRFAIPPGPLREVLREWERAAGLHVQVEKQGILDLQSPGVAGLCTEVQALEKALEGTGVRYRLAADRTVVLELAG